MSKHIVILCIALPLMVAPLSAQHYTFLGLSAGDTRLQTDSLLKSQGFTYVDSLGYSGGLPGFGYQTVVTVLRPDQSQKAVGLIVAIGTSTNMPTDSVVFALLVQKYGRPSIDRVQQGISAPYRVVAWGSNCGSPTSECAVASLFHNSGATIVFVWPNAPRKLHEWIDGLANGPSNPF